MYVNDAALITLENIGLLFRAALLVYVSTLKYAHKLSLFL